jgi:hypothetical protein
VPANANEYPLAHAGHAAGDASTRRHAMKGFAVTMLTFAAAMHAHLALAGPLDPECTAEKAGRSAATKATVGVGGRCSPAEAAKDTAKRTAGVEDKGPLEKRSSKNDTPAEKAKDAVTKAK